MIFNIDINKRKTNNRIFKTKIKLYRLMVGALYTILVIAIVYIIIQKMAFYY